MDFDFKRLSQRLAAAAERIDGLKITVSNTDLIFSKAGYGTDHSASIPFAALFLQDEDLLAKTLDRLAPTPAKKAA